MMRFNFKRGKALDLLRGLFILCASGGIAAAQSPGIGGTGGILLHLDEGTVSCWSGTASYRHNTAVSLETDTRHDSRDAAGQRGCQSFWDCYNFFETRLNLTGANSTMPWLYSDAFSIGNLTKLDFGAVRANTAAGWITSSGFESRFEESGRRFTNDGAEGYYVGSSLGLNLLEINPKPLGITASFLFANMGFDDGDFYEFLGKPEVRGLALAGLSAEYDRTHRAGLTYGKLGLDIVSCNEEFLLFQSNNSYAGAYYRYSFLPARGQWSVNAALGGGYAELFVDGALTAANQQYFLFPYHFYNLSGSAGAYIGWAAGTLHIDGKHLRHRFMAGAGNIFGGNIYVEAHYQYRKFFGDDEVFKDLIDTALAGTGAAFLLYSLDGRGMALWRNARVNFGMRKILGYWWGMDKFLADEKQPPVVSEDAGVNWALVRTILLSGLSGHLSVMF